jgi:hypothetical protein
MTKKILTLAGIPQGLPLNKEIREVPTWYIS